MASRSPSTSKRLSSAPDGIVFPYRLRELRQERRWSQAELARRVSIQRALIGNYELGINQPTIGTALRLAKVLGVSLDSLVVGGDSPGTSIHDQVLHSFFLKADGLPYETKAMIKSIIEGLLAKTELERLLRKDDAGSK